MKKTLQEQQKRIINMMRTINEQSGNINELDFDPYSDRGGMVRSGQKGTATWPNATPEVVHQAIVKWIEHIGEKIQQDFPHINISLEPNDLSRIASIILGISDETPESNPTNGELNVGDEVTPKAFPELKSPIKKIDMFMGDTVYVLQNGGTYKRDELQ